MLRLPDLIARMFRRVDTSRQLRPSHRTHLAVTTLEDRTLPAPVVSVATLTNAVEGGDGVFRFTRTDTSGPLAVNYTVDGTAEPGADYCVLNGSVAFAEGSATADVTLTTVDDDTGEFDEWVGVTIVPTESYSVGTPEGVAVVIRDNEPPTVTVETVANALVGGDDVLFRLTRTGDTSQSLTVNFWFGGTATAALPGTVTFAAGASTVDIVVELLHDGSSGTDEAMTLTVTSGAGYTVGEDYHAELVIADDTAPEPTGDQEPAGGPVVEFGGRHGPGIHILLTTDHPVAADASIEVVGVHMQSIHVAGPLMHASHAAPVRSVLAIDFSTMAFPASGTITWTVRATIDTNTTDPATIAIPAGSTPGAVRDAMEEALKGLGLNVKPVGDSRLKVAAPPERVLKEVHVTYNVSGVMAGPQAVAVRVPRERLRPR